MTHPPTHSPTHSPAHPPVHASHVSASSPTCPLPHTATPLLHTATHTHTRTATLPRCHAATLPHCHTHKHTVCTIASLTPLCSLHPTQTMACLDPEVVAYLDYREDSDGLAHSYQVRRHTRCVGSSVVFIYFFVFFPLTTPTPWVIVSLDLPCRRRCTLCVPPPLAASPRCAMDGAGQVTLGNGFGAALHVPPGRSHHCPQPRPVHVCQCW